MPMMPGIALERLGQHLAAVDARQAQVRDQDVEREPLELLERLLARGGLRHLVASVGQPFGHDGA